MGARLKAGATNDMTSLHDYFGRGADDVMKRLKMLKLELT